MLYWYSAPSCMPQVLSKQNNVKIRNTGIYTTEIQLKKQDFMLPPSHQHQ